MLWNWVSSLSPTLRLVASRMLLTALPVVVCRSSASRVAFPMRITLLMPRIVLLLYIKEGERCKGQSRAGRSRRGVLGPVRATDRVVDAVFTAFHGGQAVFVIEGLTHSSSIGGRFQGRFEVPKRPT